MLGVSRATLREAMRTFETQGLIQRRQGVGTFVVRPAGVMETGLELLESIESMAERAGLSVKLGAYAVERRTATEDEGKFLGGEVVQISRVIESQARPVAFLVDVVPANLLSQNDLQREFSGSVLDLLLHRGTPQVATSNTEIHATAVGSEVARALHIQRGDVVLHFKSAVYDAGGNGVARSQSYFLPGFFRFRVMRRVGRA
jgi:GntR family transcriptional regulator